MKQAAGGEGGGRREENGRTSYFEGEFAHWDEERSAGEADRLSELYDDEPRGGYGFGDAPLGRFEEMDVRQASAKPKPAPRRRRGRGFEGPHSSREHWGEPAPGRKDALSPGRNGANGAADERG